MRLRRELWSAVLLCFVTLAAFAADGASPDRIIGQTFKLDADAEALATSNPCVRSALASVAEKYKDRAALSLLNVSKIRFYERMRVVSVRVESQNDLWTVSVDTSSPECTSLKAVLSNVEGDLACGPNLNE